MRRQLLVFAGAVVLAMASSPTFANHKSGHQDPPGLGHDGRASHATTVDSNAGIGDGGEKRGDVTDPGGNAMGVGHQEGDPSSETGDHDPGGSKDHNANN